MKLFIKNMVSDRCKMIVKSVLDEQGYHYLKIELGEVEIMEDLTVAQRKVLNSNLVKSGLGILDDNKSLIIERIKVIIIELVHYSDKPLLINLSNHLSEKLNYNYTYIANLFKENQGVSIEQFMIAHKIERIKELLVYDELSLSEIANKMFYSSTAHLSNQFKKLTGLTPSNYKRLKTKLRQSLDKV